MEKKKTVRKKSVRARKSPKKKKISIPEALRSRVSDMVGKVEAMSKDVKSKMGGLVEKGKKVAENYFPVGIKFINKFSKDLNKEISWLKDEVKVVEKEVKRVREEIKNMGSELRLEFQKIKQMVLQDKYFEKVIDIEKMRVLRENLSGKVGGQLGKMRTALGIPNNSDVIKLNRQINTLAKKVNNLSGKGTGGTTGSKSRAA